MRGTNAMLQTVLEKSDGSHISNAGFVQDPGSQACRQDANCTVRRFLKINNSIKALFASV